MKITVRNITRYPSDDSLGRFGGGWEYKLGIQSTKNFKHIVISLVYWQFEIKRI